MYEYILICLIEMATSQLQCCLETITDKMTFQFGLYEFSYSKIPHKMMSEGKHNLLTP